MNESLYQHVYSNLQYQQDDVLGKFVGALKAEYKQSLLGVVFYGSCMRTREYQDAMLDFYVIVDDYQHAYSSVWHSLANKILAPNVFYLQVALDDLVYRSKYAVISKSGLSAAVERSFHPYFWARFTQPLSLVYTANDEIKKWIAEIQCAAAITFTDAVKNSFDGAITSEAVWVKGLQLTYSTELRTETKQRATMIYASQQEFYDGMTANLLANTINDSSVSRVNFFVITKWKLRVILGKLLSVLRLMKATTTFVNGVDYIAWKIERHTGEKIVISDKLRRHPLIYCWPLLFKFYKQGKVR